MTSLHYLGSCEKKNKKYKDGTKPRDNNLNTLYNVAAWHVVLVFHCFKGLQALNPDIQENIVGEFIKNVLSQQNWDKEPGV